MTSLFRFDNTYTQLPTELFIRQQPKQTTDPKLVIFNAEVAYALGLDTSRLCDGEGVRVFCGNLVPAGADPIAQAYAGHQFGHFTILGDGRALLLGEHVTANGQLVDIQLKGSGPTAFSRGGDGRAALGPMLREYMISEAMAALGIATTRSLAVVTTGELVQRETLLTGAVLTRVAASHLRVGTFEYAARLESPKALRSLADYAIHRHYPDVEHQSNRYLALLEAVIDRQALLIAQWMNVGFVHGVMNTDNMAISGETIDYGPCAFMSRYDPATVFSSIDRYGRYAYSNQPPIAQWNLARFAECLLSLLHPNLPEAVAMAEAAVEKFCTRFEHYRLSGLRRKLGLTTDEPDDQKLSEDFLAWMHRQQFDFTNGFRALCETESAISSDPDFITWQSRWLTRRQRQPESLTGSAALMRQVNPAVIPRNHRVEEALAASQGGDYAPFHRLMAALKNPFDTNADTGIFSQPDESDVPYRTYCGT